MHELEEAVTRNFARSLQDSVRFEHRLYSPGKCRRRAGSLVGYRNQSFLDTARVYEMT
jgi:hypothetical protein